MPAETATREFPTPAQWIAGGGVTIESVGFDRHQYGGRPAALREDLRHAWHERYTAALAEGLPEPAAWDQAWQHVHETYERERFAFKPSPTASRKDTRCSKATKDRQR